MAIVEVKVPQLSESVAEATMLQWKKKAGEAVAVDEILIEIETDKVVLEVPAPAAGVLAEILVADGGTVVAEQLIARIDTEGKGAAAAPAPAAAAPAAAAPAAAAVAGGSKAGVAMPAAAKLMADNNLPAGSVAGTGKDGRVTKGDVLGAVAGGAKPSTAPVAAPTGAPRLRCPRWRAPQRLIWATAPSSACP
jgi:2-oxoglutarate dehydrogenase E2 component (dihydrolipoamide succinyltransferase)